MLAHAEGAKMLVMEQTIPMDEDVIVWLDAGLFCPFPVLLPVLWPPSRALSAHGSIFVSHSFSQTKTVEDEDVLVFCALTYVLCVCVSERESESMSVCLTLLSCVP